MPGASRACAHRRSCRRGMSADTSWSPKVTVVVVADPDRGLERVGASLSGKRRYRKMVSVRSPFRVSACLALAACGTGVSSEPSAEKPTSAAPERPVYSEHQSVTPAPKTIHRDAVPAALLERVLADAAKRAGVQRTMLEVVSSEKLTWNDGSLGCAQDRKSVV